VLKFGNTGPFIYKTRREVRQIVDGTSKTMFVGEASRGDTGPGRNRWVLASRFIDSMRTTGFPLNTPVELSIGMPTTYGYHLSGAFRSEHPAGANFVFGDGRVSFIPDEIDMRVNGSMATIAGNPFRGGEPDVVDLSY
jgi:prepilin-type processing-associated H-X9-DG protein